METQIDERVKCYRLFYFPVILECVVLTFSSDCDKKKNRKVNESLPQCTCLNFIFLFLLLSPSCIPLFVAPWTAAHQAPLSCSVSQSLLKLLSFELVMTSNSLILCRPLLLLPSIFPSIRVFSNESVLRITWPKYWSFRFSISSSNEYSGLISFRIDWLNLLAVQGTLKSLLLTPQFKSINSLVLRFLYSPTVTFIHDYWKNHSFDQEDLCWQSDISVF